MTVVAYSVNAIPNHEVRPQEETHVAKLRDVNRSIKAATIVCPVPNTGGACDGAGSALNRSCLRSRRVSARPRHPCRGLCPTERATERLMCHNRRP
jgi:hypothetical protein